MRDSLKPANTRKIQIDDGNGILAVTERLERRFPLGSRIYIHSSELQGFRETRSKRFVIFDDQEPIGFADRDCEGDFPLRSALL